MSVQYASDIEQSLLHTCIALIDRALSIQLAKILQHPKLQALEASWRGVFELVGRTEAQASVKIKVLALSRKELIKDLAYVLDFDQSQLFQKVYSDEFGIAGGEPFGLLVADYTFGIAPADVAILRGLMHVGAAAFVPVVTMPTPEVFGVDDYRALGTLPRLDGLFTQSQYTAWNGLRQSEDSRFLTMVLPQWLVRSVYSAEVLLKLPFVYSSPEPYADYLWGNAAYAFAITVIQTFVSTGWFELSGEVPKTAMAEQDPLMIDSMVYFTEATSQQLQALGFIALAQRYCQGTVIYHPCSVIDESTDLSRQLPLMLGVCRFAHYIKLIGRDKLGSFADETHCQQVLSKWLLSYTATNTDLSPAMRARYPLQGSSVEVRVRPNMPGSYWCIIGLTPHHAKPEYLSKITLITRIGQ